MKEPVDYKDNSEVGRLDKDREKDELIKTAKKRTKKTRDEKSESEPDSKSIEESLADIDKIIEKLKAADTPLEEMFRFYEEGVQLLDKVNKRIDKVEKDLIVLDKKLN